MSMVCRVDWGDTMQRLLAITVSSFLLVVALPCASLGNESSDSKVSSSSVKQPNSPTKALDWRIQRDGCVYGQLQDTSGQPIARAALTLSSPKQKLTTTTDTKGRFRFNDVPTGAMLLSSRNNNNALTVRIWQAGIAPPKSQNALLLVEGRVTRAQSQDGHVCSGNDCGGCNYCLETPASYPGYFDGFFQKLLRNPWLVGTGTAAAIAIPIAANDDDERAGDAS